MGDSLVGILNVLKPPHMTSHDVVAIARGALGTKKIGHTGTLDPMAAGVLPLCVGKATKIVQWLQEDKKKYRCALVLGETTETQDRWGGVIEKNIVKPFTREEAQENIQFFVGDIEQIPPMYSAVKIGGKKLYELARKGKTIERSKRKCTIEKIDLLSIENHTLWLDITCSKGTYIRTLCHDIGQRWGCGAHMGFLLRLKTGVFEIDSSITIETLRSFKANPKDIQSHLYPMDYALSEFEDIHISDDVFRPLLNGVKKDLSSFAPLEKREFGKRYRVYGKGQFIGVAQTSQTGKKTIQLEKRLSL